MSRLKHDSFIFTDVITKFAESIGYFDAGKFSTISPYANYVHYLNGRVTINEDTVIGYFPGCFAHFHKGHKQVIDEFKQSLNTDNYLIVIAPANSDYTTEKYGVDSLYATNKYRYDRILKVMDGYEGNVAIDLNPMLNMTRDANFTDLIHDFVTRQRVQYTKLAVMPTLLCGKDRDYFSNLAEHTNLLNVFSVQDTTGSSSSNYILRNPKRVPKKKLLLRCYNWQQFRVFDDIMGKYYSDICPIWMYDELNTARKMIASHNATVTICKDYKDLLPYVPIHRKFENPLSDNVEYVGETDFDFSGKVVLDSDMFSGGTACMIERRGGRLVAPFVVTDPAVELLDVWDFYEEEYNYPRVDLSTRCSLPAFSRAIHGDIQALRISLQHIPKHDIEKV